MGETKNTQQLYDERLKRIHDAVALKEPDRTPIIIPGTNVFANIDAGYTMADVLYDNKKALDAIRKYLIRYEPDSGYVSGTGFEGTGPMLEKSKLKSVRWAGMPGDVINKNSVHQFIEYETFYDDEFKEVTRNLGEFSATKYLPRIFGLLEPMRHFDLTGTLQPFATGYLPLGAAFARDDVQDMIRELVELNGMWNDYFAELGAFAEEVEKMGFPIMAGAPTFCAFDFYSDYLRGTLLASMDIYEHPDDIEAFMRDYCDRTVEKIKKNPPPAGRLAFMPMHKGMDTFLSDAHYAKFYWSYLRRFVDAWIEVGAIPYIYTEAKYSSRLKYLKELPKGKTVVHFEDVDPVTAKKELGDIACISGFYPARLLTCGTKQQVVDEAKRLLDICAPGGGFIFDFDGGIYDSKRENMEALYDTLKTHGKY
ncbi:MAG: hypothetical protein LBD95_05100 [Clostridiales Family XIII bacterium]|nr:hypothetical protein [Clostridiales Family XIII bacterium]